MKLIRVSLLKHIEAFSDKRVANMLRKMQENGVWEKPICIEQNHMLILDGQHRFEVSQELGLSHIPCELFDYNDDGVLVWSLHKSCEVSKELVIERALSGDIYPYKTAKHKFPRSVSKIMMPLKELKQRCREAKDDILSLDD